MVKAVSSSVPEATKQQIIDVLVGASFILHSGGKVITDFAKVICDSHAVDLSIQDRMEDEKMVGMNGGFGEGGACTSLARAYTLLLDNKEDENAEELKKIAMGRFLKEQFAGEVEKVRSGW